MRKFQFYHVQTGMRSRCFLVFMGTLLLTAVSVQAQDVYNEHLAGQSSMEPLHSEPLADMHSDSLDLRLPSLTSRGTLPLSFYYGYWGSPFTGFADWQLHQGLNASLSASAIFGLGRHGGSGFSNSLSLMYAGSVTPKLSFALGGYASFLEYGGMRSRDAGFSALLDYRIDEHWETSAFLQKSIVQPHLAPSLYWLDDVGDKIGASVRYHFNPSFSIGVSVWNQSQPNPIPPYHY